MSNFWIYVAIVIIVAVLGAVIMGSQQTFSWYTNLIKTKNIPPSWVFILMWSIIYLLLAYVIYKGTSLDQSPEKRRLLNVIFAINLFLNLLWTYIFFNQHNIRLGLLILILLLASTIWLMYEIYTVNKTLSLLLLVYIIWLCVALYFNWSIVTANSR